ncbi:MAG: hypothetical protein ABSE70_07365 [Candidatus Limnocylindrales bacterium]
MRTSSPARQVNIRVPVEVYDVLDAAAWVQGTRMQGLLAPVLKTTADRYGEKEAVRMAVAARQSGQASSDAQK